MIGIYCITNLINNKRYIGMSINIETRWKNHRTELRGNRHHSSKLQRAWNKYGEENFKFEVIKEVSQPEGLEILEKELIKEYDSYKNGYNCSEGGEKLPNYTMPEKTRKALLEANKGNKHSLGKTHTEEYKERMSMLYSKEGNPFYNKKHSDESKKKMSEAAKKQWDTKGDEMREKIAEANRSPERRLQVSEQVRGEGNANASLREIDVIKIRIRYKSGEKPSEIAKDYEMVSLSGLKKICYGTTWKHIPNTLSELENMLINYQS